MRTSAASAICSPPPSALPCTAAITGCGSERQPWAARWAKFPAASSRRWRSSSPAPCWSSDMKLLKSRPAQKLGPSPEMHDARAFSSAVDLVDRLVQRLEHGPVEAVVLVAAGQPDVGDAVVRRRPRPGSVASCPSRGGPWPARRPRAGSRRPSCRSGWSSAPRSAGPGAPARRRR